MAPHLAQGDPETRGKASSRVMVMTGRNHSAASLNPAPQSSDGVENAEGLVCFVRAGAIKAYSGNSPGQNPKGEGQRSASGDVAAAVAA